MEQPDTQPQVTEKGEITSPPSSEVDQTVSGPQEQASTKQQLGSFGLKGNFHSPRGH